MTVTSFIFAYLSENVKQGALGGFVISQYNLCIGPG